MVWNPDAQSVLHVEDDMLIAEMTAELLRELGFLSVASARTLQAAEAAIRSQRPDIALLDFRLGPHDTVLPLALTLRMQGVPVVLVTGMFAQDLPVAVDAGGAGEGWRVLEKPFSEDMLERALRKALG